MKKRSGLKKQKELARKPLPFPNWKPLPPVRGICHRCEKEAELDDWLWRQDGPQKKLWCSDCRVVKLLIHLKKSDAEWKASQALLAKVTHTGPKQHRPSLSPEGNVPLMIRLLKEGKTKKEQFAVFKELYGKLRPYDYKFILSRVKLYRKRALDKLGPSFKKGKNK